MRLVLASGSPRRREMLTALGLDFEVVSPDVDESRHPDEAPSAYAERLARAKAAAVAGPGAVVVAADTIVVHRGIVMGKPVHPAEARSMLERLSGERHTVISGVAVARWDGGPVIVSDTERTAVSFVELTLEEIAAYVDTGEPMDKAGAYGLQGAAGAFVDRVEGSPSNVVGLPLSLATRLLRAAGVRVLGQST
ncbi:MAG: Maf family protein [Acidimicrobiia bacterium]